MQYALSGDAQGQYLPEISIKYRPSTIEKKPVKDAEDMVNLILGIMDKDEFPLQEKVAVLLLDDMDVPIGAKILFIGSKTEVTVDYQIVYQLALICGASQVVIAHNHPGADFQPSNEDINSAIQGAAMGRVLGIRYRDDLILCRVEGEKEVDYFSMADANILL